MFEGDWWVYYVWWGAGTGHLCSVTPLDADEEEEAPVYGVRRGFTPCIQSKREERGGL